jgi:hypothetical protein
MNGEKFYKVYLEMGFKEAESVNDAYMFLLCTCGHGCVAKYFDNSVNGSHKLFICIGLPKISSLSHLTCKHILACVLSYGRLGNPFR